jgi:iron complex transport system substrate-binding protein
MSVGVLGRGIIASMFLRRWLVPLLLLFLSGCQTAQKSRPAPSTSPVSTVIQDDLGRDIALQGEAKRVIAIGPGAVETVFALGAEPKLVGRDSWADYPAGAKKVAVAGDYTGPSVEKCIALRPDLVIVQGETWDKGRVESWQKQIGVPVAALTATNLKAVQDNFRKMGNWLGQEAAAARLARSLEVTPTKDNIQAFVEVGRSPLFTAGEGTLVSDVLRAGGFANVASDLRGYHAFGLESLLARQPAVYIGPSSSTSSSPSKALLSELRASPVLSKLKCVQDGRVIAVKGDYLLRPGPRLRIGIDQLRKEATRFSASAGSH